MTDVVPKNEWQDAIPLTGLQVRPMTRADDSAESPTSGGARSTGSRTRSARRIIVTIAIEDYYNNFKGVIDRANWSRFETRVEASTLRTLDLLDEFGIEPRSSACGWIADRHPGGVPRVARRAARSGEQGIHPAGDRGDVPRGVPRRPRRAREALEARLRAAGGRLSGTRVAAARRGPVGARGAGGGGLRVRLQHQAHVLFAVAALHRTIRALEVLR